MSEQLIDILVDRSPLETVVALRGELDVSAANRLEESLAALRSEDGDARGTRLVIDLAECTFLDSSGLTVLVTLHKRITAAGGELVVRRPSCSILKILDITQLTKVLAIEV